MREFTNWARKQCKARAQTKQRSYKDPTEKHL